MIEMVFFFSDCKLCLVCVLLVEYNCVWFLCSKTSIVLAADDSVVSWGPSPTYGELVRKSFFIKSGNFNCLSVAFLGFHVFPSV